jgi:galactose-1-phosphate uridylyltransferase
MVLNIGKRYGVAVRGSNPESHVFCTHPKRPEDTLSHFKIRIGFFPELKRSKRVFDHPSPFNAEDKERIVLFLYSLRVLSWQVIG